jgi:hypothetical protein
MAQALIERYESRLHGVLSCYDRVVVTGTLPGACYPEGMTAFLSAKGIRIFDYPRFGPGPFSTDQMDQNRSSQLVHRVHVLTRLTGMPMRLSR